MELTPQESVNVPDCILSSCSKEKQRKEDRLHESDNGGMTKRIRGRNLPEEEPILISLRNHKINNQVSMDDFPKSNHNFEEKEWQFSRISADCLKRPMFSSLVSKKKVRC